MIQEDLWKSFPGTATEFEAMFPDDEACRRYLIQVRWNGHPRCLKCDHEKVWELSNGRFECRRAGESWPYEVGKRVVRGKGLRTIEAFLLDPGDRLQVDRLLRGR